MPLSKDPGWTGALRGLAWVLMPAVAARRAGRAAHRLVALRMLFVAFAGALVLVGVVVAVLDTFGELPSSVSTALATALVAVVGVLALVAGRTVLPALDCSSDAALAASYTKRFFLQVALAEAAALAGFVGFVLSGHPVAFVVGLACTALGFARLAPTAAHLEADQAALAAGGCARSLVEALMEEPAR